MNVLHARPARSSAAMKNPTRARGPATIMFDRKNPEHVRDLARELARASGVEWERLPIVEIAGWLQRTCTLADALLLGPWHGFSC
jgi:hypothetical protein